MIKDDYNTGDLLHVTEVGMNVVVVDVTEDTISYIDAVHMVMSGKNTVAAETIGKELAIELTEWICNLQQIADLALISKRVVHDHASKE